MNGMKIDFINIGLKQIRSARGYDINRNGLYNVGIIYNNTVMNLIRIFHSKGLNFFDDNEVSKIILDRLRTTYNEAVEDFCAYIQENLISYYHESIIKSSNREELKYYKIKSDLIADYDMSKSFSDNLACYYQNRIMTCPEEMVRFVARFESIKKEIHVYLNQLDLDNLIDECDSELDFCYELAIHTLSEIGVPFDTKEEDTPPSL
jgi:hypothetical protein